MNTKEIRGELINSKKKLDKNRNFVRECFINGGVISNPNKTYHLEFTLSEETADKLISILSNKFLLHPKKIARKGQTVVYLKEGDEIADIFKIIMANKSLMMFEETRVNKSIRNEINRKVNFETANLNKTAMAALLQVEAIKYISHSVGLSYLSDPLEEVARIRLANENLSLSEIGKLLVPPISKSGVNHRLRKICKIAEAIKKEVLNC